jgi:hypothetical protein
MAPPLPNFCTRRPAHICETSRYRAVFERPSYVMRWRQTGWLPFLNAYRTMCYAPEPAFRHILEEVRGLQFAA